MFDLFIRYCRMVNCKPTLHLTPQFCKDNDLTVSECTFIFDHFKELKEEYGKLYYVSKGLKKKVPFEYLEVLYQLYGGEKKMKVREFLETLAINNYFAISINELVDSKKYSSGELSIVVYDTKNIINMLSDTILNKTFSHAHIDIS